jgi:hypothetical protein
LVVLLGKKSLFTSGNQTFSGSYTVWLKPNPSLGMSRFLSAAIVSIA